MIFIHEVFNEQNLRREIEKATYLEQVAVPTLDSSWLVMVGLLAVSRFFRFGGGDGYKDAVERIDEAIS